MKLYIPRLGDTLKLTSPWTFNLMRQEKNESVWRLFNLPWDNSGNMWHQTDIPNDVCDEHELIVLPKSDFYQPGTGYNSKYLYYKSLTLPVDAQLKVERIYIRQGSPDFDSVTFTIVKNTIPNFTSGKARFWAPLDDVNTMEFHKV
jgi:hypothetical protein